MRAELEDKKKSIENLTAENEKTNLEKMNLIEINKAHAHVIQISKSSSMNDTQKSLQLSQSSGRTNTLGK